MLVGACLCASGIGQTAPASPVFSFSPPDPSLQKRLESLLRRPAYARLVRQERISVALVDLSQSEDVRYAGWDDQRMRYAASLPKIAILLGAFDRVAGGTLRYTPTLQEKLTAMIRFSSNPAASEVLSLVGFETVSRTLQDPRFRLYDPSRNGGLWVGKGYGSGVGYWRRDPLHNLSHGATAEQVARFFVMAERGLLLSPWVSREILRILSSPGIRHKFVKGLSAYPSARIYRKSGTWKDWHCDAALVENRGRKYVAVGLVEDPRGGELLARLIRDLDSLIQDADQFFESSPTTE